MKSIMHEIICSDIRFIELKLKRINLCKEQLLNKKPNRLNKNKYLIWEKKLSDLTLEENNTMHELQNTLNDLEEIL